jgi:hypothetical protein
MVQSRTTITDPVTDEKFLNLGCAGESIECLTGQYIHFENLVNHVYAIHRGGPTAAARVTIP